MIDYRKTFLKGADISSLDEIEKLGAHFSNKKNDGDLLDILKDYGFNYVRLKLWNDPYTADGIPYGAGTNDLPATIRLAQRAISKDMGFLLNFHYSDFWADPGKQILPKSWKNMDLNELTDAVHDYTLSTLNALKEAGCSPTMVQVGNEITNGLLWPYGKKPEYKNISLLVSSGIKAVRKFDPKIPVMIHLDNGGNNEMYVDWFDHYFESGEDFDIIGLSYYPFWHGKIADLEYNMCDMVKRYNKYVIVDEVSMGYTMEDYANFEKLPEDKRKGMATKPELVAKIEHPMTIDGQCNFMKDVMTSITNVQDNMGRGFFYWEPAWLPVPGSEWATNEALAYTGEKGPGGNEWANQALFNYDGEALPALEVIRDFE